MVLEKDCIESVNGVTEPLFYCANWEFQFPISVIAFLFSFSKRSIETSMSSSCDAYFLIKGKPGAWFDIIMLDKEFQ